MIVLTSNDFVDVRWANPQMRYKLLKTCSAVSKIWLHLHRYGHTTGNMYQYILLNENHYIDGLVQEKRNSSASAM